MLASSGASDVIRPRRQFATHSNGPGSRPGRVGVEHTEGRTTGGGDALAGVLLSSLQAGMAPAQALGAACNAARGLIRSRS
jgi:sugar/nucleoside kinase (ribokinase family)